jgi:hypothetical protein
MFLSEIIRCSLLWPLALRLVARLHPAGTLPPPEPVVATSPSSDANTPASSPASPATPATPATPAPVRSIGQQVASSPVVSSLIDIILMACTSSNGDDCRVIVEGGAYGILLNVASPYAPVQILSSLADIYG